MSDNIPSKHDYYGRYISSKRFAFGDIILLTQNEIIYHKDSPDKHYVVLGVNLLSTYVFSIFDRKIIRIKNLEINKFYFRIYKENERYCIHCKKYHDLSKFVEKAFMCVEIVTSKKVWNKLKNDRFYYANF